VPVKKNRTNLLINSLTPSEKRHFQLNHDQPITDLFNQVSDDKQVSTAQFIKLFHLIVDDLVKSKQDNKQLHNSLAFQKSTVLFEHGLYKEGMQLIDKTLDKSIEQELFTDALNLIKLKMYYVKNIAISKISEYEKLLADKRIILEKLNNLLKYELIHQKLIGTIRRREQAQSKEKLKVIKELGRNPLLKKIDGAHSFRAKAYFFYAILL